MVDAAALGSNKEKKVYPVDISKFKIDPSLELILTKTCLEGYPEEELNTVVTLGTRTLYTGKPEEFEQIRKKMDDGSYNYVIDKKTGDLNIEFY